MSIFNKLIKLILTILDVRQETPMYEYFSKWFIKA